MLHLFLLLGICIFISLIITITFNKLPVSWLCDYGQEIPSLFPQKRINVKLWIFPLSMVLLVPTYFLSVNYTLIEALPLFFILCLLIQLSISDLLYMIIPDQHVLAILICSTLLIIMKAHPFSLPFHFTGALIGGGIYLLVSLISILFKKSNAIGFGDIKLMASLGFLVGTYDILFIFVVTTLLSSVFLIVGLSLRKLTFHSFFPLAPFISLAFILTFL